ncbi:hypothetical protein BZA05DRAFT_442783 [Tricharina praecox]|uniref:uncharacterized protein n=1 Tax=Tricharina praecox TaxID=43433 RepID=UPI0022208DB8|nr:uncharacterized protein BZA05DRAFT_442783 [Tricharina praecox]KAI5856125.1 hypothetical protein BZA05DRAFT_442783 [Tricharina praecox]
MPWRPRNGVLYTALPVSSSTAWSTVSIGPTASLLTGDRLIIVVTTQIALEMAPLPEPEVMEEQEVKKNDESGFKGFLKHRLRKLTASTSCKTRIRKLVCLA